MIGVILGEFYFQIIKFQQIKLIIHRKFEDNVHKMWVSYFDKNKKWPSNEKVMDIWCKYA